MLKLFGKGKDSHGGLEADVLHWALKPGCAAPKPDALVDITSDVSPRIYAQVTEMKNLDYNVRVVSGFPAGNYDLVTLLGIRGRNHISFTNIPILKGKDRSPCFIESWGLAEYVSGDWKRLALAALLTDGNLSDEGARFVCKGFEQAVQRGYSEQTPITEYLMHIGFSQAWIDTTGTPQPGYALRQGLPPANLSGPGMFYHLVKYVTGGLKMPVIELPQILESGLIRRGLLSGRGPIALPPPK